MSWNALLSKHRLKKDEGQIPDMLTRRHVFLDVCGHVGPIKLSHHGVLELLSTNMTTERT